MSENEINIHGTEIVADNVTTLSAGTIEYLHKKGYRYQSEKGEVVMQPRMALLLTDPRQRHLNIPGRASNIFQLIAETFWVVSGGERVTGFLSEFLPRAVNFSDDGVNWRGAYGGRIFKRVGGLPSPMEDIVETIANSPMTRQAYVSIFDTNKDMPSQYKTKEGIDYPKDVPCNVGLNFWVSPDKYELHLEVNQRSGDIFWGTGSINLFEFSFIHELVASCVNQKMRWTDPGVQSPSLGTYRQNVTNLHYYPDNIKDQAQIVSDNNASGICVQNVLDEGFIEPNSMLLYINYFAEFVQQAEEILQDKRPAEGFTSKLFEDFGLDEHPVNTIFVYSRLIEAYILHKKTGKLTIDRDMFKYHQGLLQAVLDSKFTKFEL